MDSKEKLKLLSSLSLWEHVPADRLASLAGCLRTEKHAAEAVIFEEGSKGDGLYFISSGHVRIRKKMTMPDGKLAHKELALLGPGDCIGEMTLFEEAPRSAQALASEDCVLVKLGRAEVYHWLKANPAMAADFLIGLVQVLSKRLRRSSNELLLISDMSLWLVEPVANAKELLQKCLSRILPHLEGTWSAGACLYNEFNDEMELIASEGSLPGKVSASVPKTGTSANAWLNPNTYYVPLPTKNRLAGYLLFHTDAALSAEEKSDIAFLLTTSSRLIVSTMENLNYRDEEKLRARLSANRQQYGSGF